jgi:KaiC/GvpD/RAD55 family RecA-like ATPase
MLRTVPTGDLGLDVLLGGGWRLVKRLGDAESTTVVVRGGSGAGKTLLGIHVALELARALGGDVVVGCVEILPTEYIAQLQSARPSLPAERIALLPKAASTADGPRVYVGLMLDLDPEQPDLNASLATLREATATAGGKPVVFLVDSLIEGYGIGSSAPRIAVDDCMKFAAKHGVGLVLCEEIVSDAPSPWVFAADTVLQVGVESRERGRWIEVKKHRFGPSATGRHELELVGHEPQPRSLSLARPGGSRGDERRAPRNAGMATPRTDAGRFQLPSVPAFAASLVFISQLASVQNPRDAIAQRVAGQLQRAGSPAVVTLAIELRPLLEEPVRESQVDTTTLCLPIHDGAARLLRRMIDAGELVLAEGQALGRVVIGDLGTLLAHRDAAEWVDAIRAFAATMAPVPLVLYDQRVAQDSLNREFVRALADTSIEVGTVQAGGYVAMLSARGEVTKQFHVAWVA